jgi:hypothetical protein
LRTHNDLGEQICNHLFRDAETHMYITETDVATNEMVSDLKMTNITQTVWITGDMKARHGVSVERVWFWAGKPHEAQHVFSVQ